MTGYAALQLLLSVPALVLFVLNAVAGTLVVIVVGHPGPAADRAGHPVAGRPCTAGWRRTCSARRCRRRTGRPATPAPMERLRIWAADPMTWRDQAWLLLALPLALTLSLVCWSCCSCWSSPASPGGSASGRSWWRGAGSTGALLTFGTTERLEQRVEVLTETRNETLDHSAAELRRIERDLHDGAQARLVGLGMTLGMAADLLERDPEEARRILDEARAHDRRRPRRPARRRPRDPSAGARRPRARRARSRRWRSTWRCPVAVTGSFTERLPAPVESAVYFAVAECLANVGKHAEAGHAWVELSRDDDRLQVVVGDDGRGGADPGAGTGMRGVARRLAAFDGTMRVSSPNGGPTLVTLEVPCASSSPRTTPSSGTA